MSGVDLFGAPVELVVTEVDPTAGLSAGRRLTLRQKTDVEKGVHPLVGGPTRPELGTCGDCAHRTGNHGGNRTYPKCDLLPVTHSAASDVRAWWPACPSHSPKENR